MTTPMALVIVGAGGFGREVADIVEAVNREDPCVQLLGFLVEPAFRGSGELAGDIVPHERLAGLAGVEVSYVIGIGDGAVRRRLDGEAEAVGLPAAMVRHPNATVGASVDIGDGSVICSHVSVMHTVRLGRHVHLDVNSTVGHDCQIGDYVTVSPGANISGDVSLGEGVTVGTGAVIVPHVSVGAGTVIGAGAVVTRDLPAGVVAMGCPARPVRATSS